MTNKTRKKAGMCDIFWRAWNPEIKGAYADFKTRKEAQNFKKTYANFKIQRMLDR